MNDKERREYRAYWANIFTEKDEESLQEFVAYHSDGIEGKLPPADMAEFTHEEHVIIWEAANEALKNLQFANKIIQFPKDDE